MLTHRLATGLVLAVVLVGALFLDEAFFYPWCPAWLILSLGYMIVASLELCGLLAATSARPSINTVLGGIIALVLANWVPHLTQKLFNPMTGPLPMHAQLALSINALAWPLLAFAGVLMIAFVSQGIQFSSPGNTMATLGGTILAISYLGILGTFVLQLRWMNSPREGITAVAMLMATAKGADIGAYFCGRAFGRHKLWPRLSPNKTIEGAVGGLMVATLLALAVAAVARQFDGPRLSLLATIGFGLVVGAAAQLGDLMESMIKRDCERKDASDTLPGFGGVLDVIDSVLFAGPAAYVCWMLITP